MPARASVNKFVIETEVKVKNPLLRLIELTSSNPEGLKAVSRFLSVNKELPSASLKLPILKEIVSVGSFKFILIGTEIWLFSSEFNNVFDIELLLTCKFTTSAFASIPTVIVLKEDWLEDEVPVSDEDAITFKLKSDFTLPPVIIPRLDNSALVKDMALTGPDPKSKVVVVPTSVSVVVFTNRDTSVGHST